MRFCRLIGSGAIGRPAPGWLAVIHRFDRSSFLGLCWASVLGRGVHGDGSFNARLAATRKRLRRTKVSSLRRWLSLPNFALPNFVAVDRSANKRNQITNL
jgi:hypothetical protein